MNVVLLGAPGSGKGTQARILADRYRLPHVSTGELFRQAIAEESVLGLRVKDFVEDGKLVPDELVVEVGNDRLGRGDCKEGFILDGLPRTLYQARALDEFLEAQEHRIDVVLYFDVDEETVVKRLSGRRSCKECSAQFHVVYLPPKTSGVCDYCGAELIQRKDDQLDTVLKRLKLYEEENRPLMEYYRDRGVLKPIPAAGSPEEVAQEVQAVLDPPRRVPS